MIKTTEQIVEDCVQMYAFEIIRTILFITRKQFFSNELIDAYIINDFKQINFHRVLVEMFDMHLSV